jgi:catechol 2,3-dioxygenase-like lactoylglutathione lyase family enzyme
MTGITGVLETCLYADDLPAAERFYGEVLGLAAFAREEGRHVFFRCGAGVLLVFDPSRTSTAAGQVGGVPIPPHGATGAGHVAFAVPEAELPAWRARLAAHGVAIEAEVAWPRGGRSLYVRDPAGNSVELAPAGIWGFASDR